MNPQPAIRFAGQAEANSVPPGYAHVEFLGAEAQMRTGTCLRSHGMLAEPDKAAQLPIQPFSLFSVLSSAPCCLLGDTTKTKEVCMTGASQAPATASGSQSSILPFTEAIAGASRGCGSCPTKSLRGLETRTGRPHCGAFHTLYPVS